MPRQNLDERPAPGRRIGDVPRLALDPPAHRSRRSLALPGEPPTQWDALDRLVRLIEHESPGMRGSILLLDDDGVTLRHGAAPHLPPEYCRRIDGSRVGPSAGSCGTAVWRRAQVIVRDIATDPLWEDYRDVALAHGLRACWSTPIVDGHGDVLGSFAMYYAEPREPSGEEQSLTQTATLLACNIIVRTRAEQQLQQRLDELEEQASQLAESEARARAAHAEALHANQAKADFLATMSHELRTPLNAIGGYVTLMLDGIPTPPADAHVDYLRRVGRAQQHLLGLIDAVLTHAKLEAGRMTYRMTNVPVDALLVTVESLVAPQLAAKQLAWDHSGCDRGLVLRADEEKVTQILLNLISNATKFTAPGGCITVRTSMPAPGRALIGVRDTGVGMTADQVATVFEPFVQFDNRLTRTERGSGLGMTISRELARGMGGDLTVESTPGAGTEFALTLAADPEPARVD